MITARESNWPYAYCFWPAALLISLVFASNAKDWFPHWAINYPRAWTLQGKAEINSFMKWLINDANFGLFTFKELTRGFSSLLEIPLNFASALLANGFSRGIGSDAVSLFPSLSWIAVITVVVAMGSYAKDWKLGVLVAACFAYLALFGRWESAMITLSSIAIAVPFGVVGGLLAGIAAYRWQWFEKALSPVLDLMQTVPVFAYLVPVLFLFGFGPVAAMIATIIYAMPPMVRVTILALRNVPEEIIDFGRIAGCTNRQLIWKVLVPSARPGLMVGVNQVIMLSLNMVIIASMIGAGGLGFEVLSSLRRLDIGGGLEAGVAIVVLAIALDRLSQAFAIRAPALHRSSGPWIQQHPWLLTCALVALGSGIAGFILPGIQTYPESWQLTSGTFWSELVKWINVNYFDHFEAVKNALLLNILIPVKRFLTALPWAWVILLLTWAGVRLGGVKLGLLVFALSVFILMMGLWQKAMVTVYLCGISVLFATMIGMPIGIAAASNDRLWKIVQTLVDTLQTLPSFVYLIPVVMLFRVGDFSAMIAVVAYALAPAIRYTAHGIREIDPQIIEAGVVSGCTKRQLLWKIKLPLAMPQIMLGINQTIMLALSMLVITALVGTRDLGQEVYIALTKADTGRGIIAGLSVAFIAIIADRMISAGSAKTKARLGLA